MYSRHYVVNACADFFARPWRERLCLAESRSVARPAIVGVLWSKAVMPGPPKGKTSPGDPLRRERANEKYDSFSRLIELRHTLVAAGIEAIYRAFFPS